MDFILTLDLGTTHIKAQAIDPDLRLIDEEMLRVQTKTPKDLYQHQNPEEIKNLSETVVRKLLERCEVDGIKAIVFSNAMHSIFPVDKDCNPLYEAIIWSDLRAGTLASSIRKTVLGTQLSTDTGTPVHAMSPLFKILWLKENEKELFQTAHKFISIKEYLIYHWFGVFLTDYSTASATGLFNISTLEWSPQSLELAGIGPEKLPKCVDIYHNLNVNNSDFLKGLGISNETPVLAGATDGCLAVIGGGHANLRDFALSIGTSAAIRTAKEKPIIDPEGRIFNYYMDEGLYITGGPSNNGGNLLEWCTDNFLSSGSEAFDLKWPELLKNTSPGSQGLIFLPYLFGERAPLWDASSSGSFHGIRHQHQAHDFARAVLEGMLMNLRVISEIVDIDNENEKLVVSGGVFNIPGLAQLVADIFNKPVVMLENTNLSSRGAAILGWKSLDVKPTELDTKVEVFDPDRQNTEIYSEHFSKFKDLLNTYHP